MKKRKAMNPRAMRFSMSEPRRFIEDEEDDENCRGCLFRRQKSTVCYTAAAEAIARGMLDCDAIDTLGRVIVYVQYNQVQTGIPIEEPNE
jgi:hypothetical protein